MLDYVKYLFYKTVPSKTANHHVLHGRVLNKIVAQLFYTETADDDLMVFKVAMILIMYNTDVLEMDGSQTSQLSRFGRETHDFNTNLTTAC